MLQLLWENSLIFPQKAKHKLWSSNSIFTSKRDSNRHLYTNTSGGSDGKESACNAGDPGSVLGSGRSPGEGNGNPL